MIPSALPEEKALLGACLVTEKAIDLAIDAGLQASHFSAPSHVALWNRVIALTSEGKPVDPLTTTDDPQERDKLMEYAANCVTPGKAGAYAARLIEVADLRQKWTGAQTILEAASNGGDPRRIEEGTNLILTDVRQEAEPTESEELRDWFIDYINEPAPVETLELPWTTLNEYSPGGFQRGHLVLVAAFTSMGKSILIAQMVDAFNKQDYRCRIYTTEMTREEILSRHACRMTGIPATRILLRNLDDPEKEKIAKMLHKYPPPYALIDASSWTVDRIRLDARRHRADCIVIDPVNLLPYKGTEEANEAARAIQAMAKDLNACVVAVTHLNRARQDGENYPRPALRDIRDTGMFESNADRVLYLYRENQAATEGELGFLKVRGGTLGKPVPIDFDGPNFSIWEKVRHDPAPSDIF